MVHLGDLFDADGASRWENENQWTLAEEYDKSAKLLQELREASGASTCVWLEGNHESNASAPNRIAKKLRELCHWTNHNGMAEEAENWRRVTYYAGSYFRLGQVTFFHGTEHGVNSDRNQCLAYGVPNGLSVSGHTHRPVRVTQVVIPGQVPLPYWYANVGCGADFDKMTYIQRSRASMWGRGMIVGECNPKRAWFSKPEWDAELRFHSGRGNVLMK